MQGMYHACTMQHPPVKHVACNIERSGMQHAGRNKQVRASWQRGSLQHRCPARLVVAYLHARPAQCAAYCPIAGCQECAK